MSENAGRFIIAAAGYGTGITLLVSQKDTAMNPGDNP
jgi:hypothetical protein